jgi:hypothetical protein
MTTLADKIHKREGSALMRKTICDNCGDEMGGPNYHYSGSLVIQPGNVLLELSLSAKPAGADKDVCGRCCREALELVYAKTERHSAQSVKESTSK